MDKKVTTTPFPCHLCLVKTVTGRREWKFSSLMSLVRGHDHVTPTVDERYRLVICLQCHQLLESALGTTKLISELQSKVNTQIAQLRAAISSSEPTFERNCCAGEVSKIRKSFLELSGHEDYAVSPISTTGPPAPSKILDIKLTTCSAPTRENYCESCKVGFGNQEMVDAHNAKFHPKNSNSLPKILESKLTTGAVGVGVGVGGRVKLVLPPGFLLVRKPAEQSQIKASESEAKEPTASGPSPKKAKIGQPVQGIEQTEATITAGDMMDDSQRCLDPKTQDFQVNNQISDDEIEIVAQQLAPVPQKEKLLPQIPGCPSPSKTPMPPATATAIKAKAIASQQESLKIISVQTLVKGPNTVKLSPQIPPQTKQVVDNADSSEMKEVEVKSHLCSTCDKSFSSAAGLKNHRHSICEKDAQPFPCPAPKCDASFTFESSLHTHIIKGKCREHFRCQSCSIDFGSHQELDAHKAKHHGENPEPIFKCDYCPRKMLSESALAKHLTTVHPNEKPFKCDHCSESFSDPCQRSNHVNKVHEEQSKCSFCKMTFSTSAGLKQHMDLRHGGQFGFKCNDCGQKFGGRAPLATHQIKEHGAEPYVCDECGAKWTDKYRLKKHKILFHGGATKHTCDICQRPCATAAQLENHTRSHTNERPYVCCYCGAAFKTLPNLTTHEKRFHSEEGYKNKYKHCCPHCEQRFEAKYKMEDHIRTVHTEVRPYACQEANCDKKFVAKSSLFYHKSAVHGIKPVKDPNRIPPRHRTLKKRKISPKKPAVKKPAAKKPVAKKPTATAKKRTRNPKVSSISSKRKRAESSDEDTN